MLKMLLEACGNAGEGAARLAMMYYGMELTKFVLLLLFWSAVLWLVYKALARLIYACDEELFKEVRDDISPCNAGTLLTSPERTRVRQELRKLWRERKT